MTLRMPPARLPIGDVARMLDIPQQTINSWRNREQLPEFGQYQGDTKARLYNFAEMLALALMRDLTVGPAGIGAAHAAVAAVRFVEYFLEEYPRAKDGAVLFSIEAAAGHYIQDVVPLDQMSEYVKRWRDEYRQKKRSRLELVDVWQVALRVSAKLARREAPELEASTEEEVMDLIRPCFSERLAMHLGDEIARYDEWRSKTMAQAE
jgi:hypothetical protein